MMVMPGKLGRARKTSSVETWGNTRGLIYIAAKELDFRVECDRVMVGTVSTRSPYLPWSLTPSTRPTWKHERIRHTVQYLLLSNVARKCLGRGWNASLPRDGTSCAIEPRLRLSSFVTTSKPSFFGLCGWSFTQPRSIRVEAGHSCRISVKM